MKRSTSKILTTHVGSLPEPAVGADGGDAAARLHAKVTAIVQQQRATGIDIINEGECAKGGDWLSYLEERFAGFELRPPMGGTPVLLWAAGLRLVGAGVLLRRLGASNPRGEHR